MTEPKPGIETLPNVREIVRQYLDANGYDGLYRKRCPRGCGCGISKLFPWVDCPVDICSPALRRPATAVDAVSRDCNEGDIISVSAVWDRELAIRQIADEMREKNSLQIPRPEWMEDSAEHIHTRAEFTGWFGRRIRDFLENGPSLPAQKYGIREA